MDDSNLQKTGRRDILRLMKVFYSIGVWTYTILVHVFALWNVKARKWVRGRHESWKKVETFCRDKRDRTVPLYWFHCASLGEFEQARPVIEAMKYEAKCQIAISFFSPSGYEIRKNYELADLIFYLPTDSVKNAKRLLVMLHPSRIFFVKYEFWAHYILTASRHKVPFYSICAVFRNNQIFFKWYGSFMRKVLKAVTAIFVQDEASKELLEKIGIQSHLSGDTRYDRVMKNSRAAKRFVLIDRFTEGHRVFVCGSLWNPDLNAISIGLNKLGKGWKIILTTHEIHEQELRMAESFFKHKKLVRYSDLTEKNLDAEVLLIDNIGMLMHVYGYADLAYVGGAFKTGLHNILEPASFGLPVIFGPHHAKFPEAGLFIQNGIGFSVADSTEFENTLQHLIKTDLRDHVTTFMQSQTGATAKILHQVSFGG